MDSEQEILDTLQAVRRNQEKQLEGMGQSLAMQREQLEMAKTLYARAERLVGSACRRGFSPDGDRAGPMVRG